MGKPEGLGNVLAIYRGLHVSFRLPLAPKQSRSLVSLALAFAVGFHGLSHHGAEVDNILVRPIGSTVLILCVDRPIVIPLAAVATIVAPSIPTVSSRAVIATIAIAIATTAVVAATSTAATIASTTIVADIVVIAVAVVKAATVATGAVTTPVITGALAGASTWVLPSLVRSGATIEGGIAVVLAPALIPVTRRAAIIGGSAARATCL